MNLQGGAPDGAQALKVGSRCAAMFSCRLLPCSSPYSSPPSCRTWSRSSHYRSLFPQAAPICPIQHTTYNRSGRRPLRFNAAILSRIVCTPPIGSFVARALLNDNKLWRLRALSLQVPESVVHLPLPFHRLTALERERHAALADKHGAVAACTNTRNTQASRLGGDGARAPPMRWSVLDYHDAYQAGRTTPSAVARKLLKAIPRLEAEVGTVFTEVQRTEILRQAKASDARFAAASSSDSKLPQGPRSVWEGVPIAVKEMISIEGHITGMARGVRACRAARRVTKARRARGRTILWSHACARRAPLLLG